MQSGRRASRASTSLVAVDPELPPEAGQVASVPPGLGRVGDEQADQLEVGVGVDPGQDVPADVAGAPGDDSQRHCRQSWAHRSGSPKSRLGMSRPPSASITLPVMNDEAGEAQEEDGGGDLFGLADPAQRGGLLHRRPELVALHDDVERGGGGRADADGVDPDARGQVLGGQPGVMGQGGLDRAVGEVAAPGRPAHDRRDVDDGPAAGGQQVGDGRPDEGVGGGHVEVERLLQEPGRRVEQWPGHRAADVVDEHVDPAERLGRGVGEAGDRVEIGQVGRDDDGPATGRLDLRRHGAELFLGPGGQRRRRPRPRRGPPRWPPRCRGRRR